MKVAASSLQKGNFVNHTGIIWQIVKAEHNFHGRGSANYRFKFKSVINENTVEVTCKPDNLFDRIDVDSIQMQFLYKSGDGFTFMNEQTYEQVDLEKHVVGDFAQYMKEGQQVYIMLHDGKPLAIRPPASVRLTVTESEEAVKGDTATNAKKPVKVESGATVMVPIFIKKGDTIVINPEDGSYIERSN